MELLRRQERPVGNACIPGARATCRTARDPSLSAAPGPAPDLRLLAWGSGRNSYSRKWSRKGELKHVTPPARKTCLSGIRGSRSNWSRLIPGMGGTRLCLILQHRPGWRGSGGFLSGRGGGSLGRWRRDLSKWSLWPLNHFWGPHSPRVLSITVS